MGSRHPDIDIFPRIPSKSFKKLIFPDRFEHIPTRLDLQIFIVYLAKGVIGFYECEKESRFLNCILNVGKDINKMSEESKIYYSEVSAVKMERRLKKQPGRPMRNSETRLGFHFDNTYLVKPYFTFGQKRVGPDEVHVVQTTKIPLNLFVKRKSVHVPLRDRSFSVSHLGSYIPTLLPPDGCYRIPPETVYMLISSHKNLFSLHVLSAEADIPIPFQNPLSTQLKLWSLKGQIDTIAVEGNESGGGGGDEGEEEEEDDISVLSAASSSTTTTPDNPTEAIFGTDFIETPSDPAAAAAAAQRTSVETDDYNYYYYYYRPETLFGQTTDSSSSADREYNTTHHQQQHDSSVIKTDSDFTTSLYYMPPDETTPSDPAAQCTGTFVETDYYSDREYNTHHHRHDSSIIKTDSDFTTTSFSHMPQYMPPDETTPSDPAAQCSTFVQIDCEPETLEKMEPSSADREYNTTHHRQHDSSVIKTDSDFTTTSFSHTMPDGARVYCTPPPGEFQSDASPTFVEADYLLPEAFFEQTESSDRGYSTHHHHHHHDPSIKTDLDFTSSYHMPEYASQEQPFVETDYYYCPETLGKMESTVYYMPEEKTFVSLPEKLPLLQLNHERIHEQPSNVGGGLDALLLLYDVNVRAMEELKKNSSM